jgi:hypothetical protein
LWDRITISEANNQAREVAHLLAADFRVIGSGIPLGSSGFDMLDANLGEAPLPILTDSTETKLRYRLNEYGRFTSLTASFNPDSQSTISVFSSESFPPNSFVYISNMTSEFSQSSSIGGARAKLSSISPTMLGLSEIVATQNIEFNPGSTVEPVSDITLNCGGEEGITRFNGESTVVLYPKSSCFLTYLDPFNNPLDPPLTIDTIRSQLTTISFTVSVPGRRPLRRGGTYTAEITQNIALRNLILARNS